MQRLVSGVLLGAAALAAVWTLDSRILLVVAEAVVLLACVEYVTLASRPGARVPIVPAAAAALLACAAMVVPAVPLAGVALAAVVVVGARGLLSYRADGDAVRDAAVALLPMLYLGLPLGALVAVHARAGREAVLLLLVTVVASDTGQYYVGRALGRRSLAPAISPKKTIEGAIGGVVLGTVVLTVAGAWWLPAMPPAGRAALGVGVTAVGIAGDLFESALKRSAGRKDASGLIPGHGGVLDRIDALLFAAPLYYLVVTWAW